MTLPGIEPVTIVLKSAILTFVPRSYYIQVNILNVNRVTPPPLPPLICCFRLISTKFMWSILFIEESTKRVKWFIDNFNQIINV